MQDRILQTLELAKKLKKEQDTSSEEENEEKTEISEEKSPLYSSFP